MMNNLAEFSCILNSKPHAFSKIKGSPKYPKISGFIGFFQTKKGVLVASEISGLPHSDDICRRNVFAYHIHMGEGCFGTTDDPFADAMSHYNPHHCDHPYHAGDLPPLFENDGYAFAVVLTDRFSLWKIIGKTVIIHREPDDFTTQPSGNAGEKIACGVIVNVCR